jgi:hypothetical protein
MRCVLLIDHQKKQESGMPDFEIRYYHADGKLAVVHMCIHKTIESAKEFARINLKDYAHFEVRAASGNPIAAR